MKCLDLADARIAYTDDGEGEAVLLLHGSLSPDWFAPAAAHLAGHRVLRTHRAGYGKSEDLIGGVGVDAHAEHCAEVLRASGVRRAHVAGHSAGACVALQLAHAHPALVGSLMLFEAAFPHAPDEPRNPAMPRALAAARAGEYERAFDLFLGGMCGPGFRDVFVRELGERGLRDAIESSQYFFTTETEAFAKWSFGPAELAALTAPVLLVVGGEGARLNTAHRARSARIAALLSHSETRLLPGVSHAMPLEDPTLIARTIGDFVTRHPL
ncbi:alpha/beta hydrolase [Streptomyces sp. NPDC020096]